MSFSFVPSPIQVFVRSKPDPSFPSRLLDFQFIFTMSRIVNRGEFFDDSNVPNKWKWEWLSKSVQVGEQEQRIGQHMRKIDVAGTARCLVCTKEVAYGKRGIIALTEHVATKRHQDTFRALQATTTLPGSCC